VAIKCYHKSKIKTNKNKKQIFNEIQFLKECKHPNIIQIYEVFENIEYIFFVTEYVEKGDLFSLVKEEGPFEEKTFLNYFIQTLQGLQFIHNSQILHRDIKLDNMLLNNQDQIKICDFGISKRMAPSQVSFEHIGTPVYLAPEIIQDNGYSGFGVDIWSLGVTTYIALTGEVPFKGNTIEELKENIKSFQFDKSSVP
jgi:serine/threonine protein kinase